MSNRSASFVKSKFLKKISSSKSPGSNVSSSLYSGVASAERAIQQPGSAHPYRTNQLKYPNEQTVSFACESFTPSIEYHSWESKYNQIHIRENQKKSMTKDPYTPKIHAVVYAKQSITSEAECSPKLIPANAVHIEEAIIQEEKKTFLPNIIQPEITSPERPPTQIEPKKPSITQIPVGTTVPLPKISTTKNNGNLLSNDRIKNRAKIRNDASVLRRPPKRSAMDTIHEAIAPLAAYG